MGAEKKKYETLMEVKGLEDFHKNRKMSLCSIILVFVFGQIRAASNEAALFCKMLNMLWEISAL